jgi:hypothetical protein
MGQRLDLQELLEGLLGDSNVYFQPPENIQMVYPCIVYGRYIAKSQFADGMPYIYTHRYQVTVIDPDPDSEIPDKIALLPMCTHNRSFSVTNLNHDIFNLYY